MPDSKITALTSISTSTDPANDPLVIVDVSDTSMAATGTTKKVTLNQLLGSGGTATLASATITGDLTVASGLLKTDSANTRIGIGTLAPSYTTHIRTLSPVLAIQDNTSAAAGVGGIINFLGYTSGTSGANVFGQVKGVKTSASVGGELQFFTSDSAGNSVQRYLIDSTGVSTWAIGGSTAMTLNATGLGVGGSPASKLTVSDAAAYPIRVVATAGTTAGIEFQDPTTGATRPNIASRGAALTIETGGSERLRIDSSGNVGIGVTPSYKLDVLGSATISGRFKTSGALNALYLEDGGTTPGSLYIGTSGDTFRIITGSNVRMNVDVSGNVGIGVTPSAKLDVAVTGAGTPRVRFTSDSDNPIVEWQRFQGTATNYYGYRIQGGFGALAFLNSNVAAIGSQTWTQAMTLDASGNLLVAATSTSLTTGTGLKILQNSGVTTVGTVGSSSSDVDTTYRLYSSTASAYRFYVGYGGTVYATNTTISAISDARLKENVQDIDVGLGAILALKPRKFDWKAGKGKDIKGDRGFIAQEFEQVFPQLVDEWADPAPEGEAPYKSVRQDLIPVLVKAIQELAAEVNALKNA